MIVRKTLCALLVAIGSCASAEACNIVLDAVQSRYNENEGDLVIHNQCDTGVWAKICMRRPHDVDYELYAEGYVRRRDKRVWPIRIDGEQEYIAVVCEDPKVSMPGEGYVNPDTTPPRCAWELHCEIAKR